MDVLTYEGWSSIVAQISKRKEINFVVCQIAILIYSCFFRAFLGPQRASATTRHAAQLLCGLLIGFQSIGWEMLHLLFNSSVCYVMMNLLSPRVMQKYVSGFAILYLATIHIWFMIIGKGVGNFDIVGPLMVLTEKMGCLGWSLHDGLSRKESELNNLQKKMVVRKIPSVLEYFSFVFYPQSLLAGPIAYFSKYSTFIQGTNFKVVQKNAEGKEIVTYIEPSCATAVWKKIFLTIFCAEVYTSLVPKYPIMGNIDENHLQNSSFWYKMLYAMISVELAKSKYIFGWALADAMHNAAGLGFSGYDAKGNPKWDGLSQVDIWHFQFPTSLRVQLNAWNKSTLLWLRYTCYERMPYQRSLCTFLLSSIWHGFFPGYFFCFVSGHLFMVAAKKIRANLRPVFQGSQLSRSFYDFLTWATTYVTMAYVITPFTYLTLDLTIKFFNSIYWWLHIVCIIVIVAVPSGKKKSPMAAADAKTTTNKQLNGRAENGMSLSTEENHNVKNEAESKKEI